VTAAEVFETFARPWNTDDDAERLQLLAASCVPDAAFVSPQGLTSGIHALSATISEFRHTFPAAVVTFGRPDEHAGFARVAWATHWNNDRPSFKGEDFAQLASDGRLQLLVSFDNQPAASR
jgi:hypothetical protein